MKFYDAETVFETTRHVAERKGRHKLQDGLQGVYRVAEVYVSIPSHTRNEIPSETSFTYFVATWLHASLLPWHRTIDVDTIFCTFLCHHVISILIKSRTAVSNTECRSRYEKLPYFRFEQSCDTRLCIYGNGILKFLYQIGF